MGSWYIDKIIIDSNEKKRGHRAYNYYNDTYDVDIQSLENGDYLFLTNDSKNIVFEFKTCKDFISSMENRTLFNEVSNQSVNNEYSYLVVCGDFKKTFDELYFEVPYYRYKYKTKRILVNRLNNQVNGAFQRMYSMYIPIIFAKNEEEAFNQMLNVSIKVADAKKYGGIVRPTREKLIENSSVIYLTTIKGIGDMKAKNITNELDIHCLDDLCEKKPSDFLSVNKITKKDVIKIWKKIHNENLIEDNL